MIQLLTFLWLFNTSEPAQSVLNATAPWAEFAPPADPTAGFTVRVTADLKEVAGARTLLEIPGVLLVRQRQHDPANRDRQNYPAYRTRDGSVPVIEATLVLHSPEHPDWTSMTIGIPLAMLRKPFGEHELVLNFSGVTWTMYVDGALLDKDFPFGYPEWGIKASWAMDPEWVKKATLHVPALTPEGRPAKKRTSSPAIQYWVPEGHNNWVGDVATCYHQGRYHIFYLYDRRHHGSKFGCGAHYFEHLSTADFRTWTEHEAATPLEQQWECIGTGSPFIFNGRLCLSYGLHTTRVYPRERTALPEQWDTLNQNGRTGSFTPERNRGVPAGATYAVSADGVAKFRKSHILFHPCENPSVYTDPSGRLRMMANYGSRGIWESDSPDGGWRCISPDFPPGGDCTFFFRWGRFDYVIGGFTGLWFKPAAAADSEYADLVHQGLDFYDGLAVPSVCGIGDGRFLMAGWLPVRGWGGCLVIRELIQYADGRIGSKWLTEVMPRTKRLRPLAVKPDEAIDIPGGHRSFLVQFKAEAPEATKGRFALSFRSEHGEQAACELQVRVGDRRAQLGPGSLDHLAAPEKSLREGGSASAIENLLGVDRPFTVRVIVKGTDKLGGSVVDAEIAGQRTLIAYRPDLTVRRLLFRTERVELKEVQFAPLEE
jgi:hypothetical protein